jgi:hypothetical protein
LESVFSKQLLFEDVNVSFFDPLKVKVANVPDGVDGEIVENDDASDAGSEVVEEPASKEITAAEIWEKYNSGLTVKLLTPQVYIDGIWKLLSILEHEFQNRVSAEVVLAPPSEKRSKSAPTVARPGSVAAKLNSDESNKVKAYVSAVPYDNVNAFVLQLEGQSRWRVMPNPHPKLNLATEGGAVPLKDIDEWSKPMIDIILTAGDSLHIPKGWVYQQDNHGSSTASAADPAAQHSLHLKVCCSHGTTAPPVPPAIRFTCSYRRRWAMRCSRTCSCAVPFPRASRSTSDWPTRRWRTTRSAPAFKNRSLSC